jgi:hypothetical protein
MSISTIINPETGKIYDELVPQGGGIPLQKGQIITALNGGKEVPFPTSPPINGSILSYNDNEPTGLKYIPSANIEIDYQELLSSTSANVPTVILPPAQNGYVLTANTNPSNPTGLAWEAVGGTGKITATLPLVEEAVNGASNLYINFTGNVVGQIPYGNGTAKTGALTNVPSAGQILGINAGIPTWITPSSPSGGAIINRNSNDTTPLVIQKPTTANDTMVLTTDRVFHPYTDQIKNTTSIQGTPVSALANDITFFTWPCPEDILLTSMNINIFISANAQIPDQLTDDGTCNIFNGQTLVLSSNTSTWNIINQSLINFTNQQGSTAQLVKNTTYTFIFQLGSAQGVNPSVNLIDTNGSGDYSGNITLTGIEFTTGAQVTFSFPTGKFRVSKLPLVLAGYNNALLQSYTSQSYVSSADTNDWIQIGLNDQTLAYQ